MVQNRRDLCLALAALGSMAALAAEAETPGQQSGSPTGAQLVHSALFPFDNLPVRTTANGGDTRAVLRGTLATGEFIEVHETTLPPGQMPHPAHRHTHSELLLIRDGRLEVTSGGQQGVLGAGGVAFNASGLMHGVRNVGDTPAHYFIVAVGVQKALP